MRAYERFLQYVTYPTQSREDSGKTPSTDSQWTLAKVLCEELQTLGVTNAHISEQCYVYASLPATPGMEDMPALGWIAHMDTATDFAGEPVHPIMHELYDGNDVVLGESGRVLRVRDFPRLREKKGCCLITTDGTTLLGGDDKAGIAEIMTYVEELLASDLPHGKICIGFTPDEEIGEGADHFDLAAFGADVAYTVDGETEGEIQFENFNATGALFTVQGVNVHPGAAKNIMKNAALIACRLADALPKEQIPAETEGYEGFFHLLEMSGSVESATLKYIVRDHDAEKFAARLQTLEDVKNRFNDTYGEGTVTLTVKEQYRNMAELIKPVHYLIEDAIEAAKQVGIVPLVTPIRGGTDGARLSYMGLPCPNIGTGGEGCHGPFEHITVESMDRVVAMLHAMTARIFQNKKNKEIKA